MSEVQRFWCHDADNIMCVREWDYDNLKSKFISAQSELAALREELAVAKRKHLRSCQIAIGKSQLAKELQQRLTAAEQRNSDLVALLECVTDTGELTRAEHEELEADICAAVKAFWDKRHTTQPTESGASE